MIFISLGSNIGNRLDNLWRAVHLIKQNCLHEVHHSIILETEAIVPKQAPSSWHKPFLNMIIGGRTALSPTELLHHLKSVEREMGRPAEYERWAPRVIDLDILLYNNLSIETSDLIIPHPELNNRHFLKHLLALMQIKPWSSEHNITHSFIKSYVLEPRLVGVINLTTDSFSDGGKFYDVENAVQQVLQLEQEGASFIELGAQSTRPHATIQSVESEHAKLDEVLSHVMPIASDKKLKISIDSFHPSIVLNMIKKYNVHLINDVSGQFDNDSLKMINDSGCQFCLMHSLTIPPNRNHVIPTHIEPTEYLLEWGKRILKKLEQLGFSINDIILDPGIGFGKTPYQNIHILKNIEKLKTLGCKIMLGHSRKSYIQTFYKEAHAYQRDIETLAVSLAIGKKIDFLRVHNVKDHMRAMVAHHLF